MPRFSQFLPVLVLLGLASAAAIPAPERGSISIDANAITWSPEYDAAHTSSSGKSTNNRKTTVMESISLDRTKSAAGSKPPTGSKNVPSSQSDDECTVIKYGDGSKTVLCDGCVRMYDKDGKEVLRTGDRCDEYDDTTLKEIKHEELGQDLFGHPGEL